MMNIYMYWQGCQAIIKSKHSAGISKQCTNIHKPLYRALYIYKAVYNYKSLQIL